MNIGQRIKQKRKKERLSAEDLALKLGLKKENIYKWERGSVPSNPVDYARINIWLDDLENVPHGKENGPKQDINLYQGKYIKAIEEHNRFLQKIVESNLIELSAGQRLIQAQVKAVHQWDAIQLAKGNKKKEEEMMMQINRQIASNLAVGDKEGILSGKSGMG